MNKTIIININGIVFHIEEDAYDMLREYMTAVKAHFAYTPDSVEIITDIENRLAEMFSERLALESKQVIIIRDVEEVTAQMGKVSDFDLEEEEPSFSTPESMRVQKKLLRDMDDRVIAGVCAGVGHYFDIEPRWIRLIALLMLFFGGTSLMIYIILWIVMPKAITRTDKMAMKGEPINIQNFKKNFDEEVENIRRGLNRAHNEVRPSLDRLGSFITNFFKIIIKIVGGFIVFIGTMTLFGLIVGLISFLGFWHTTDLNFLPFKAINPEYKPQLILSAFLLVFIPLVSLVLFAIRVLFDRKVLTKTTSFALLIFWLSGLGMAIYFGSKVGAEFKEEATFSKTLELKPSLVYYLKLNQIKYLTKEDSLQFNIDSTQFSGTTIINRNNNDFNSQLNQNIRIRVELNAAGNPSLIQSFSSRGPDFKTALRSAQQIKYRILQTDSILQFDSNLHLLQQELWRDQGVDMKLRVPLNTRIIIDRSLYGHIEGIDPWDCQDRNSEYDGPTEWLMTLEGLKCKNDSLYRKNQTDEE